MAEPFRISQLTFNSGKAIDTRDADIVVLVGPNNTGKTRTLLELFQRLQLQPGQSVPTDQAFVLDNIALERQPSHSDVVDWFRDRRYTWTAPNGTEYTKAAPSGQIAMPDVRSTWESTRQWPNRLGILANHMVRTMWCSERLGYLGAASRLDLTAQPDHSIHWLLHDDALMKEFKRVLYDAFSMNVIVDAWGSSVQLRLSSTRTQKDFEMSSSDGLPSKELAQELARLQTVDSQSDGVKSFAGVLLSLISSQFPLVLLDEPEAFLHPPQARILGQSLAGLLGEGQLFVSTHSLDILLGLIESHPERVMIVRLTRSGGTTIPSVLEPSTLAGLWADPLLRFSRALDGLFHDGVAVCEGITDSQFYTAIADGAGAPSLTQGRHVMFSYAGSKHRVSTVASALRAVGVPVRAIVDFDALRESSVVRSLVEGVGGQFTDVMVKDLNVLDAHLRGNEAALTVQALLDDIKEALGKEPSSVVTSAMRRRVGEAMKPRGGWKAAKTSGVAAVPPGEATVAVTRLLEQLREAGVWVVPSGEVESFVKQVPGDGTQWWVGVAEGGHVRTAEAAREFVGSMLASLPGARPS